MGLRSAILYLLFFFLAFSSGIAQQDSIYPRRILTSLGDVPKPVFTIGTGMLSFRGDVAANSLNSPLSNKFAYQFGLSSPINSFLDFNFYFLAGKIATNERSVNRNLNFLTEIKSGGAYVSYNFDHLLNPYRNIEPFVLLGIESFEFLSKADLYDANGNKYFYWSDGSIRNFDQNSSLAPQATIIRRDYDYETDIRKANLDGFGNYKEASFAIPMGIGVKVRLSDQFSFKLGSTLHYTFTDYLDGVTDKSLNSRKGNKSNDKFLMTSISLSYDMVRHRRIPGGLDSQENDLYKDVDYLAIYNNDEDEDGVRDFIDRCPGTPPNTDVDKYGCPLDQDGDGVPDYKDEELETPENTLVINNGSTLTDELIEQMYRAYMGYIEPLEHTLVVKPKTEVIYSVEIGVYKDGKVSEEVMNQILNLPNISSVPIKDKIAYLTGEFRNPANAEKTKEMLVEYGLTDAKVVEIKKTKEGTKIIDLEAKKVNNKNKEVVVADNKVKTANPKEEYKNYAAEVLSTNSKEIKPVEAGQRAEYRVMLGAYTKGIPPNLINQFLKIPEIKPEKINDSITVYSIGKYSNDMDRAVSKRADLVKAGIKDAVLVRYENGKYIPVSDQELALAKESSGISKIKPKYASSLDRQIGAEELDIKQYADESFTKFDPKNIVVFRVQLGAYKNRLSQNIFKGISGVLELTTEQKLTKYLSGSYTNYYDAANHKVDMVLKGFEDAFIVAYKNGQRVSLASVGAQNIANENLDESKAINAINKSLIAYKIEIGTYKGDLPVEVLKKLGPLALELEKQTTMEGMKRYTIGDFKDYMSALIYKNQTAKKYDLKDIKVTSFFKDDVIPLKEALDLTE